MKETGKNARELGCTVSIINYFQTHRIVISILTVNEIKKDIKFYFGFYFFNWLLLGYSCITVLC